MVEFVFLGVVLLVPVIYLILTTARLQGASYAATAAAREAARAYVSAPKDSSPQARADAAARLAFADQGFEGGRIVVRCAASPCLTPDARVEVTAHLDVDLPLIPAFLADALPSRVAIDSTHAVTVDRYRELP